MKILVVMTSQDWLGDSGTKTGFWLEEFAAPYYTFLDGGAVVTIASPKGGQPPLDPKSDLPENQTRLTRRFRTDTAAQAELANTKKLADMPLTISTHSSTPADMARCGTCPTTRHPSR